MLPAGIGILAALAFVLGLIAFVVWLLKRFSGGALTGRNRLQVEVVQRLPLGPKSGLAVVRVGEKVLAVSVGDGGVHTLFEVDEADRQRIIAGSELPMSQTSSVAAQSAFAKSPGGSIAGPLQRAFDLRTALTAQPGLSSRSARTPVAFGQALSRELENSHESEGEVFSHSAVQKVTRAVSANESNTHAIRRPSPVNDRDLRSVLSMTLAPTTRLLSFVAVAAISVLTASVESLAQGAPTPPVAAPSVQPAAPATAATSSTSANALTVDPASAADAVAGLVPQLDLRVGSGPEGGLRLNGTVGVVLMMGLMTLVPTLLLMMTGFTRILIVLHFLKQAMGTQSAPPAHLVAGLALLLTGFVMAPTITEANRTAITPWLNGTMEQTEMLKVGVKPFREFMLAQTNEKDLRTFVEMSRIEQPDTPDDIPLHVLMSAFVASELRTAFQIGFAIYLPFIVIDAVVASVLMAMGMFMLPPAMISLPFKLLLFVLVDGWSLTMQSLIQSFR